MAKRRKLWVKSKALDKALKAKHPGKRTSASGEKYYEYRKNRSDKNRTKKLKRGGLVGFLNQKVKF